MRPAAPTLCALLDTARRRHPRRPALSWRGRELTYGRLWSEACALAGRMRGQGVRRGDRVAVYLERSAPAVVAVHACLRLGAPYVPVDPQSPWPRLMALMRDCGARALVTESRLIPEGGRTPEGVRLILLDRRPSEGGRPAGERPSGASDPAYILYTSGSTGVPKGVLMSHRNASAFVGWAHREFRLRPSDRVANLAPFQFDLSVFDLFDTCRAGASLHIIPYPDSLFAPRIARFLAGRGITVFYTVPSVLAGIAASPSLRPGAFPALRLLLFAGEVIPPVVLRRWLELAPKAVFYNLYGPTETNVCLSYRVPRAWPDGEESVPIGRPLPGTRAKVLRPEGGACSAGERGELWVKGPTVMERYADGGAGRRQDGWYGTGDIVSLGKDGLYRFWGRQDDQVKVRGYRVDLKEVEAALCALPGVAGAAAAAEGEGESRSLVAHVSLKPGRRADAKGLLGSLSRSLPSYMVPSRLIFRKALPRLSTGKLDRRALAGAPALSLAAQVRAVLEEKVLRGQTLGDEESFWDTGTLDSLDLLQFVHHLEASFLVRIPETDVTPEVFSSIASVSRYLSQKVRQP